jgi:DNA-binding CsgD family transcriptional regulator
MAARIRDDGPEDVAAWLLTQLPDPADRWRLLFVLAAAVPVDVPWLTLTSWAHDLDPAAKPVRAAPAEVAPLDAAAMERACAGEPVQLQPRARRVVVDRLTAQGLTAPQIADRLRVSVRTVERHRGVLRSARTAAATPQQLRDAA